MADSAAGAECSEGHFHCDSCLARHAETFLDFDNLGQRKEREGHLKCSKFPLECNSGFADRDLAKLLHIDLFKTYLEARVETIKAQMQAQLEVEMKDRLGAELQRLATLDEHSRKVLVGRKHIIEEILSPCRALVAGWPSSTFLAAMLSSATPAHATSAAGASPIAATANTRMRTSASATTSLQVLMPLSRRRIGVGRGRCSVPT